jgi:hypothetical protein
MRLHRVALALAVPLLALSIGACVQRALAATTFGGQLQACVHDNSTREAIDACRARVEAAWTVPDGAADGAAGGAAVEGGTR